MIAYGTMEIFPWDSFKAYLANLFSSQIIISKINFIVYKSKASDYIVNDWRNAPGTGQLKENVFLTKRSCNRTRIVRRSTTEMEGSKHRRIYTNYLKKEWTEFVSDEMIINYVHYKPGNGQEEA